MLCPSRGNHAWVIHQRFAPRFPQRSCWRRLADRFGVGTVDEDDDGAPSSTGSTAAEDADEIDVTIVLGSDAQDLIGRLESSG